MSILKKISCILICSLTFTFITNIPTLIYASNINATDISPQVIFKINGQWSGQFIGEILITNPTNIALTNWEVQFDFPHKITSVWNAVCNNENNFYTLQGESYNNIIAPHQTLSIGFIANYDYSINLPQNYILKSDEVTFPPLLNESINNISTPCSLELDIPNQATFISSKDELWFSFTPSISASYEFITQGNANLFASLYDETKHNIILTNQGTSNTKLLGTTLLANKKYYIKITPLDFNPNYPNFNLTVTQITAPNDPLFPQQWALLNTSTGIDINILPTWQHLSQKNTLISILDTGTYYKHEDLCNNINLNLSYNFIHNSAEIFPEDELYGDSYTAVFGHGTHIAGIIAAESNNNKGIAGIVPSANLISLKTFGRKIPDSKEYNKSIAAFEKAIEYAQENNIQIITCSFGSRIPSSIELNAMRNAKNILFVIAAGNSGNDLSQTPIYPACYSLPNAIVVADITSDGTLSSSSNYGGPTDLAAPGTDIISTIPYDNYEYMSGTSMAVPFVAGVCGLVWAKNESLSPEEVKTYISNSANVTHLDSLKDTTLSGGLLNAYKAVVCPNLNDETRTLQSINNPFSGNIKEKISYYKSIAPINTKTDEVIVKFKNPILIDEWIERLNNLNNFDNIVKVDYLSGVDAYVLRFSSIAEADLAVDLLNGFNEISYAEPNYIRE